MNGTEGMLRAMGLGPVLDAANQIAASGAVAKLLLFADRAERIIEQLDRIERHIKSNTGSSDAGPNVDAGIGNNDGVAVDGVYVATGSLSGSNPVVSDSDAGLTLEGEFSVRQTG